MKNFNQIVAIGIIVLCSMSISTAQNQGPVLAEKLEMPEKIVKQTLQKRSLMWIEGQWTIENNQYIWVSGHWATKKIGYVFINGQWSKKSKGWTWTNGYWKKININKLEGGDTAIPSLGVLLSLVFGLVSLGLFVFFIHSISKAIQVDNVLNGLFSQTKREIKAIVDRQSEKPFTDFPDFTQWHSVNSTTEGYYKGVHTDKLCAILAEENIRVYISVNQGYFTVKGYPFLKCDKDISNNEELIAKILDCFIFYIEEYISDHYRYGLTQISEIAVKAIEEEGNNKINILHCVSNYPTEIKDVNLNVIKTFKKNPIKKNSSDPKPKNNQRRRDDQKKPKNLKRNFIGEKINKGLKQ